MKTFTKVLAFVALCATITAVIGFWPVGGSLKKTPAVTPIQVHQKSEQGAVKSGPKKVTFRIQMHLK